MSAAPLLYLALLSACRTVPPAFQDRLVATLPADVDPRWTVAFSPDGRQVAYIAKTAEGSWAVRGTWKSRRLDTICCMAISDDGNRVAYMGGDRGAEVISLDDRIVGEGTREWRPIWPLSFSGDGQVVAYAMAHLKERKARIVVDGREGPLFASVGLPSLSRDGRVVAYRAERNDEYFIRIRDRDEPACDFVTDPAVSGRS